jgi:signal transduction histidine kinase
MGKSYLINNLQFSEHVDKTTLNLPLKIGAEVAGYLTWQPSPGATLLLQRLIPSTILILLLLGILAVFITRHVVAAARGHEHLLQELSHSKDAAEVASIAKSKFLATMSHELRTPMNGLLGMIGLLKESELTKTQQAHLAALQKSSHALMHIIEEVLEFSQLESKAVTLNLIPVDIRKLVEEVHSFLMPVALQKKLSFETSVNPDVPQQITADTLRLRQILLYLSENAIKFTNKGSVKIAVEATPLEDQRCMLTFKVMDTGIGIAEDIREKLFQDFFQGDSSRARQFEGAGLGLAIAKHLTQLMGGTLGADSTLGKGSTFWVRVTVGA